MEPGGAIQIARIKGTWADLLRAYQVELDGQVVARLSRGDTAGIDVEPGPHSVRVRLDWCSSESLDIHVAAGNTVHLECQPRARAWAAPYWITLGRQRYIGLNIVPSAP